MQFRIADTFTDGLAKLTGDEQKAVKITVFDLQADPVNPGMQFHKLDKARDYLRVNSRIDVINSSVSLGVLLVFWFAGGFPWLDGLARSFAPASEVPAGLIFLSAMFLGQSLISLPFTIYETFVIERNFGFNRITPATFIMDRLMKKIGLHGRAFVPLMSGFACAVPAILATRTMERKRDRMLTMMVLPLMTCSARLPVYALIIGALFPPSQIFGLI